MKILITESQLKSIIVSEQPESRYGPEQFMNHQERQDFRSGNAERRVKLLQVAHKNKWTIFIVWTHIQY